MKLKITLKPNEIRTVAAIAERGYMELHGKRKPHQVSNRVLLRRLWLDLIKKHEGRVGKDARKPCTLSIEPAQYLALMETQTVDTIRLSSHPYEYALIQGLDEQCRQGMTRMATEMDSIR